MINAIALDPASDAPLHRQLYEAMRKAILSGRLNAGAKLPSTRTLAEQLDLSRNTVMSAYDQLLVEGYLVGQRGSGTYVAEQVPDRLVLAKRAAPRAPEGVDTGKPRLSKRGAAVAAAPSPFRALARTPPGAAPFQIGSPAYDEFPADVWGRLLNRRWHRSWSDLLPDKQLGGYGPLRQAIAEYLVTARGVRCTAEQVIVVSGSQQAFSLAAHVLLDPGECAWVEDPGYIAVHGALVAAGARPCPVPVDDEGLDVAAGRKTYPKARVAFVTPAHQMPLGITMSLPRRLALLEWAERNDGWVFEDDYDSEFRYEGRPLSSLQGLDASGRVIYCGTFSKVLSPSLRIAYLVVPEPLVDAFIAAKSFTDVRTAPLEQAVLTDFITEGHFLRHVRRMRALYAERQAVLVQAAGRELNGLLDVPPMGAGMHLVGWLRDGVDDRAAAARAKALGMRVISLSDCRLESTGRGALLLGYAAVNESQIVQGVRRLRSALR